MPTRSVVFALVPATLALAAWRAPSTAPDPRPRAAAVVRTVTATAGILSPASGTLEIGAAAVTFTPRSGSPRTWLRLPDTARGVGVFRPDELARSGDTALVALNDVTILADVATADALLRLRLTSPTAGKVAFAGDVAALASTAWADSCFALTGRPATIRAMPDSLHGRAIGFYVGALDALWLNASMLGDSTLARQVVAHEAAHRLQQREPRLWEMLWGDVPSPPNPWSYGATDRTEAQAQAFAAALQWLSETTAMTPDAADARLAVANRLVPGTAAIARWVLAQPLGRRHPLAASGRGAHIPGS